MCRTIRFTKGTGPNTDTRVVVTRLLAFIAAPNFDNWIDLIGYKLGRPATDRPFLHRCHNGHGSRSVDNVGCVNGVDYGSFGTGRGNSRRKACKHPGRQSCPGWDSRGV